VTPFVPCVRECHRWIPQWHKPYLKTKLCMDVWLKTEVMAIFVIFWPVLTKIWLPWQRPLDPCNQKCLLWIGWPQNPPVISNRTLVISRRNAFMCINSNFCPKIGCHGNALCPLCTGVSHMNSPMAQTLSQNQTLHGCVAYNWSYVHFVIFWPILAKIWLPWQRPLDPCNQKCILWIGRHENPLFYVIAISSSLVEMHLCAFIAIFALK